MQETFKVSSVRIVISITKLETQEIHLGCKDIHSRHRLAEIDIKAFLKNNKQYVL